MAEKRWSAMSPQELLDRAQARVETAESFQGSRARLVAEAQMMLQVAQIQAIENLSWTLENRIAPTIADGGRR